MWLWSLGECVVQRSPVPGSCLLDVSSPSLLGATRVGACCCGCRVDDESTELVSLYMASPGTERERQEIATSLSLQISLTPAERLGRVSGAHVTHSNPNQMSATRDLRLSD